MEDKRNAHVDTRDTPRHPWLAVFLSDLLPGAGQIYGGRKSRGVFFVVLSFSLFTAVASGFYGFMFIEDGAISRFFGLIATASTLILLVFGMYVLFDAYKVTKNYNLRHNTSTPDPIKKKPWLAVFLSNLVPGLGQLYTRQKIKGFALLIAALVLFATEGRYVPLSLVWVPLYFFSMKDAFDSAGKLNGAHDRFLGQQRSLLIFILIMIVLRAVPYDGIIKQHFAQAYNIPSGSMIPTLKAGDRILVDQSRGARSFVKRGDVIVFKYPVDPEKNYIKRVVGMGGDKVQIIDGHLYINDQIVAATPVDSTPGAEQSPTPAYDKVIHYKEQLDKVKHGMQLRYNREHNNGGPWLVPADKLFVLGDNRDNSQDSRVFGFVPRGNVEGKALKIYWSWDAATSRVRWERIGQRID